MGGTGIRYNVVDKVISWIMLCVLAVNSAGAYIPKAVAAEYDTQNVEEEVFDNDVMSAIKWEEFSIEGGVIEQDYNNTTAIKLTEDITINGSLMIRNPVWLNGHTITVHGDVIQYSDLYADGNVYADGSLSWYDGDSIYNNGIIYIMGEFQDFSKADKKMVMKSDADYLGIGGSLILEEMSGIQTDITAGTIELAGDFIQKYIQTPESKQFGKGIFKTEGSCRLLLSGEDKQNIFISRDESIFADIEVDTEGIPVDEYGDFQFGEHRIYFSGLENYNNYTDNGCPTGHGYAEYDSIDSDTVYGSVYYTGAPLEIAGERLTVLGNLIIDSDLSITSGYLNVYGDFRLQSIGESGEYGPTDALLTVKSAPIITIYGDYVSESTKDHSGSLTGGLWNLYGDICQIGSDFANLMFGSSAHVYFYDTKGSSGVERHIHIDNVKDNPFNGFINCISKDTLIIDKGMLVCSCSYIKNYKGELCIGGENPLSDYIINGDVRVIVPARCNTININGKLMIDSDFEIGGNVNVKDDIIVNKGVLSLQGVVSCKNMVFSDNSESSLEMTSSSARINCKDFVYGSILASHELSDGYIYCTGDFLVKDMGTPDSFVASKNHTLYIYGSESYINHIDIEASKSCIENLSVSFGITVVSGATCINNVNNISGRLVNDGIEGYTLENDEIIEGDMILYGGNMKLNGHTLKVKGNLYAVDGTLDIDGGHLDVDGDLNFLSYYTDGEKEIISYSNTALIMDDGKDVITVGRDWNTYYNGRNCYADLKAGEIRLAGDMNITGSAESYKSNKVIDGASLTLTGTGEQKIYSNRDNNVISVMDIKSLHGNKVESNIPIQADGDIMLSDTDLAVKELMIGSADNAYVKSITGDAVICSGSLACDMEIDGRATVIGVVDMSGHSLTADNIYVDGELTLSKGTLNARTCLYMNNRLYMTDASDTIYTTDIIINSSYDNSECMTSGSVYVSGNLNNYNYAFRPSGDNRFIFCVPDGKNARITLSNKDSLLNTAVFQSAQKQYNINRYWKDIADNVISSYDDLEEPTVPKGLTVYDSYFFISLAWGASDDDNGVSHYEIIRDGKVIGTAEGTQYIDKDVSVDETYSYCVRAVDVAGRYSDSSDADEAHLLIDTDPPTCTESITAEVTGDSCKIDLSKYFRDNVSVDHYIVTRTGEEIARLDAHAFIEYYDPYEGYKTIEFHDGDPVFCVSGLEYGSENIYYIQAVDIAGNSSGKCSCTVYPDYAPNAPEKILAVSRNGYNEITIGETGLYDCKEYCVYRDGELIKTLYCGLGGKCSYSDHDVEIGTEYNYTVRGIGWHGTEGALSEALTVVTIEDTTAPEIKRYVCDISGNVINENAGFTLEAYDDGGISRISVSIVQSGVSSEVAAYTAEKYETTHTLKYTLGTSGLLGSYTLHTEIEDYQGNVAEDDRVYRINIDGLPPVTQYKTSSGVTMVELSWNEIEGALYYAVENVRKDGSVHRVGETSQTRCSLVGYRPDTVYTFRITAYDSNGIRGLTSNDIDVRTKPDEEKPVITYTLPDKRLIASGDKLLIGYRDNVNVASVSAYYRMTGDEDWNVIVEGSDKCLDGYIDWDKEGLVSGEYQVLYRVTDSSGNDSDDVIHTYMLDVDGPVIKNFNLIPGDWKISVSWDTFDDEDYAYYNLYKLSASEYDSRVSAGDGKELEKAVSVSKGIVGSTYEEIIGPDDEYVYILKAYDIYGNQSVSYIRGRAGATDPYPPVIEGFSSRVVAKDVSFVLSGEACSDNDEIVSYEWDMGNGDIISGKICEYTYNALGSYNVTLSVTDRCGNSTAKSATVVVGEDTGEVVVNAVSDGKPLPGVNIVACINGEVIKSSNGDFTDEHGKLVFALPEGKFSFAAFKDGYIAAEKKVEVKRGKQVAVYFQMTKGSSIKADIDTHEMTLDEIREAGITPDAANSAVYRSNFNFRFESHDIAMTVFSLDDSKAAVIDKNGGVNFERVNNALESGEIYVQVDSVSEQGDKPVYTVTMIRSVSISWMKRIYEVNVTVCNEASEIFSLENTELRLNLPDGLALTGAGEDGPFWGIDNLKGGDSVTHTWYVVGDRSGSYRLSMSMEGYITPNDCRISKTFEASSDLVIEPQEGLHLYIYPESEAYIGENYYIQFVLVNESDEDFHYVTTDFGSFASEGRSVRTRTIVVAGEDETSNDNVTAIDGNYFVPKEATDDANVYLQDDEKVTYEQLKAGESVYGTYRFMFNAIGDKDEEYYRLVRWYCSETNNSDGGVEVTIVPIMGHLSKSIAKMTLPKKKARVSNNRREDDGKSSEGNLSNSDLTGDDGPKDTSDNDVTKKEADYKDIITPETEPDTEEVKDPVNLMTGSLNIMHSPIAVSGGMDFSFNMSYDSRYTEGIGELGRGWHHNYEMRLEHKGAMIILHTTPDDVVYFAETTETENIVSGTVRGEQIVLSADDGVERTYYQIGDCSKKYVIRKKGSSYTLTIGTDIYTFDKKGVLTGYIDEDGRKLSIAGTSDKLAITDVATGKRITAYYNDDGRITSVTDPAGNETKLDYENDCLTTLTAKDGNVLSYTYDDKGHILTGSEGERVYVENTYDSDGRVTSQISNGDTKNKTTFAYETDEDGNVTAVMTNADGTTETGMSDKYGHGLQYKNAIGGVRKYLYNEQGDMTEFSDMDGSGKTYSYDDRGNITEIKENTGRVLSYAYDDYNHITAIKGNDGTDISYTYNDKGQRTKVESGNGITAEYTYNGYGQVLTERSALGTISYSYKDGMLDKLTDYSGNTHSFKYDANGNVTSYTDGAGITTEYDVDVRGNVTKETVKLEDGRTAVTSYTYDAYGNMLSKTDAGGNKTEYRYDNEDRLTKEIRPDGTAYEYNYDDNGSLTEIVCPDGETKVSAAYDAAGNTLSVTNLLGGIQNASYSAGSKLMSLTQANGGKISYTYYDNGLLKTQTDANGNTSTLAYDEAGRLRTVTDGAGAVTTLSYDKDGNLASVENALGNKTELLYNEYRKVTKAVDNNANATFYGYDAALNCTKVIDAEGGVSELAYDGRNRITSVTKKGPTRAEDVTLTMTYDNLNNVTSITDGEGNTHRMEYNELSQLVRVYDAKGVLTGKYDYDSLGSCISVTDAFGTVTERSYDAFGNLIKELNKDTGNAVNYAYIGGRYLSAATDALENSASYTYDSMGNLETVTNPNGGVTTYRYDLNGNVTDEIIGEEYHVRYTYNAQNLAETKVNSRNQKAEYKYDLLGRITEQKDEAGIISYAYDGNDNVLTVTETVDDNTTTITRTYDKLNRVISYDDGRGNKIGYAYDILGNLVTLTYPNGKDVNYTYDKNGNILTMTDWEGRKTSYSYDENGRLIKTIRPNGTVETREYDKAGRLTEILDKKGDTEVNHQEYSYDSSGNIIEVKQLQAGELDFTGVNSAEMTYDKNNRLLTYNGSKIMYDTDGNMTYGPLAGKMTTFTYDCRNRLIQAGDTKYIYDPENNRIGVETKEKKTEYVINIRPELSQVLQSIETKIDENDNSKNNITTCYFYGNGLNAQDNGKDYFVYHYNNVGSTMAVTDGKGDIVEQYNYTPYGELIIGEYRDDIPFLYNGQYGVATDSNGLYYMRARYYNVEIKRFINQDVLLGVLERVSSLNRYAYVEGNPISYLDPFGLERVWSEDLHDAATVLNMIALPLNVILPGAGEVIVAAASGFDIGLSLYDLVYSIEYQDKKGIAKAFGNILLDLLCIVTSGFAEYYKAEFKMATEFAPGMMEGYAVVTSGKLETANNIKGVIDEISKAKGHIDFIKIITKKLKEFQFVE